jgi:hypothetical protein
LGEWGAGKRQEQGDDDREMSSHVCHGPDEPRQTYSGGAVFAQPTTSLVL